MSVPLQLQSLPLFPLGTVLFPEGLLPLRIFEVRYLDMIGRCHKNDTPFGIVALTRGSEVRQIESNPQAPPTGDAFAQEAFHDVGTLATISTLERPQAGLMVIQCTGTQRFRITRQEKLRHGLWTGDVELLPRDVDVAVPADLKPAARALSRVIESLREQGIDSDQLPFGEPYRLDACGWVANRWCELLQLPLELKHQLMALDNPLVRLELVRDMLDKAGILK